MSSNNEEASERNRWEELWEQLGVPPEPAAQKEAPPVAKHEFPRKIEAKSAYQPLEPEPEEPAEAKFIQESTIEVADDKIREPVEAGFDQVEMSPHLEAEDNEASAERTKERAPRRRRGRRSSKSSADKETASEETGNIGESAAEEEKSPERARRRGRGRGRSKKVSERPGAEEMPEDEEKVETTEAVNDDNEEIDNLSDWNIPSWAELIASLYRPDR